jgi:DNA-binding transcriptional regulator YiaG
LENGVDELLERVRSQRKLPPEAKRKQIREAANVTLRDVAGALGVSHTCVRKWERGSMPREPVRSNYARLLEELKRVAA